ncbi:MAG: DUF5597 domain-containing protein [Sphingomonas sp.]|nr:DUF5597 domain-containing protein [Sphingomonas sp.]
MILRSACFRRLALLMVGISSCAAAAPLPTLDRGRLVVDGKPFLILGGELANSSSSNRAYMAARWGPLRAQHLNTVLMPVSWELIEPVEGKFDFGLVDGLLADARAHDLRIVILWFGSWKNSMSTYAPGWVKHDPKRFPRARTADGRAIDILSPFGEASAAADARAFGMLMAHLAQTDSARTVIAAQVENEVGMIPEPRDHSPLAEAAWTRPVPKGLPGAGGSWTQAYGADADEAFMAWYFGRYVERVAAAGKKAYPIPFYLNAALPRPNAAPGKGYPAAGPIPKVAHIWYAAAPSIDLLEPDIYFPNFVEWTRAYAALGRPLFIPEANQAGKPEAPANALFAIGQLGAFGFSPFSIDNLDPVQGKPLADLYLMLGKLWPMIQERQGSARIAGFRAPVAFDGTPNLADQSVTMGGNRLTVRFIDPWTPKDRQHPETHGAIVMDMGHDELLVAGRGVAITFAPADGKGATGIDWIDEGDFVDGNWVPGRRLNGDESHQGRHLRLPPDGYSIQRIKLYHYD